MVHKRVRNAVLRYNLKNDRMNSVRFQGKPFNITVIQVYAPTSNAEEAEVQRFYEDLQDLLELTPKRDGDGKTQNFLGCIHHSLEQRCFTMTSCVTYTCCPASSTNIISSLVDQHDF